VTATVSDWHDIRWTAYMCNLTVRVDGTMAFYPALHGMQTRSSDENSVRLSVRLSNTW